MEAIDTAKLREMLHQAEILVDQVNHLYAQFFNRGLDLPPHEARAKLEKLMRSLEPMEKPTVPLRFQHQVLVQRFATYRELWEKKMKAFELGKI